MDNENLTPQYRIEEYLEAIVDGWAEATQYPYPDYPSWRIEEFLDAFITYIWEDGDHPRKPCPDPAWRLEECLRAIYDVMTGAATPWPFPLPTTNRIEEYLAAIHAYLADNTELPVPEPVWRIEQWLAYALDAVKQGGGVTKTVSGTMVHITNALAKAALSVLASIEPIQDLHGYDSPWPAGGGVNKWNEEWEVGAYNVSTGEKSSDNARIRNKNFIAVTGGQSYYLHLPYTIGTSGAYLFKYDASQTYISGGQIYNGLIALESDVAYINFCTQPIYGTTYNNDISVNFPATDTAYHPYSNICPITGRTGLSVYRTGKNLSRPSLVSVIGINVLPNKASVILDNNEYVFTPTGTNEDVYIGSLGFSAGSICYLVGNVPVKEGLTYTATVSDDASLFSGNNNFVQFMDASGKCVLNQNSKYLRFGGNATFTIPQGVKYVGFRIGSQSLSTGNTYRVKIQLELGSTATAYEPYNGNAYAVDWTTEAGTVYGGTLDVVTGVLTVTHGVKTLNGSEAWRWSANNNLASTAIPNGVITNGTTQYNKYTQNSTFKDLSWAGRNSVDGSIGMFFGASAIYANYSGFTTAAEAKSFFTDNPTTVVYELATPLTYQLTPQEVRMLLGENNVWSSSGDTVSVTYYAEGNANPLQSLNILLGGNYSNPKTADDVSDREALEIILGGNK